MNEKDQKNEQKPFIRCPNEKRGCLKVIFTRFIRVTGGENFRL
jgi:hypothetical protein